MSETPKGCAADGKTQIVSVVGMPLMVSASDFNRVYGDLAAVTTERDALRKDAERGKWLLANMLASSLKADGQRPARKDEDGTE